MGSINTLAKRKLKSYTAESFEDFWLKDHEFEEYYGTSRRKRIQRKTLIEVYELWQGKLILRLFYLEEGYRNLSIYHEAREIVRYLAGSNKKLIKGVYSSLNGSNVYHSENYIAEEWKAVSVDKYVLGHTPYYVQDFHWETYNSYLPLLKNSVHKYSALEYIPELENYFPYKMFEYLEKYNRYPILEVLIKMGMSHLISETFRFRIRFSTLPEVLGVNKQDFKYLKYGMSLEFVRKNINYIRLLSSEEYEFLWSTYNHYENINLYNLKELRYIVKNGKDLTLYSDYLKFAEEIGLEMDRNSVLYPNDLKSAHDDAFNQLESLKEEKLLKGFLEQFEVNKNHIYQNSKLLITPVKLPNELVEESKVLNHCVRGYANDVAKGKTEILFIRKEDNPETPYITVEVKEDRVIQVRGTNNSTPPENVKEFLLQWSEEMSISYNY